MFRSRRRACAAEAARRVFGVTLHSFQRTAVEAIAAGRNVLAVQAAASGKSLCYQLPPFLPGGGLSLVVSPLISLMEDQVASLRRKGVSAAMLGAGQDNARTLDRARRGEYKVLYLSPEFLVRKKYDLFDLPDPRLGRFEPARPLAVGLLAIDEAHCISSWGHDFRPEYREIAEVARHLMERRVPVLAMTATATPAVRDDIHALLQLGECAEVLRSTMDRPNHYYEIRPRTGMLADLGPLLDLKRPGDAKAVAQRRLQPVSPDISPYASTVIYVRTRALADQVCAFLCDRGVVAVPYHGEHELEDRREVQRKFGKNEAQVVVATVAFGMGVDKPDIRRIVHYGAPHTIEEYVQQVGRAGRDGQEAVCVCFAAAGDEALSRQLLLKSATDAGAPLEYLNALIEMNAYFQRYLNTADCRRQFLKAYFGESEAHAEDCGGCDNCRHAADVEATEASVEARLFLETVDHADGKTGMEILCQVLTGSRSRGIRERRFDSFATYAQGAHKPLVWWRALGKSLRDQHLIEEDVQHFKTKRGAYTSVQVAAAGRALLEDRSRVFSVPARRMA